MRDGDGEQERTTLDEVIAAQGVHVRPLRQAIALLLGDWRQHDDLVRDSTLPRRSLGELLDALAGDLEHREVRGGGRLMRIAPSAAPRYRPYAERADQTGNGGDGGGEPPAALLAATTRDVAEVPVPLAALDHVQATPETVLRRALWLDERYDLRTARLLFLGDHDLTSLAVRAVRPEADLTVVDLDERLLAYVDERSAGSIRTVHADLRFGLPPVAEGAADLVFSDPPYTPEGMGLFAARGISCLAEPARGRLLLAYGYSPRHPALGGAVQRRLSGLGLTFEAIIPDFHRYLGAQAIGSAADLYVCQPTAQAAKATGRRTGIYTHGPQSVESERPERDLLDGLAGIAAADGHTVETRRADWAKPASAPAGTALVFDLTADPGPWLLRVLLATNAGRVATLLPNSHPDLGDARSQAALSELLAAKYRLRFLRSTPDNTHAVVLADAVAPEPDEVDGAGLVARSLLTRAHGKLANTAREALVRASGTGGTAMTKNEARAALAPLMTGLDGFRLIDLPRHRLAAVLTGAAELAAAR
ncbi:putative methyltransferase [Amycolatopsis antarctica]|uniref:Putative methyltransferase n=1 Tax=Amycolatopsis antarctica TaxID=1854586 RepID=A0A263D5I0_9PSEU|nr:putative methyltransferase [Amycolatopsis antarctica]